MYFSLKHSVEDLVIASSDDNNFVFEYGGKRKIQVTIHVPSADELEKLEGRLFAVASLERTPNEKVFECFKHLKERRLPEGSDTTLISDSKFNGEQIKVGQIIGMPVMPRHLRSFAEDVQQELREYLFNTVTTLRWRQNLPGPHNPLRFLSFQWSFDKQSWYDFPGMQPMYFEILDGIQYRQETFDFVIEHVSSRLGEPLAHELLREAWGQRFGSRRSAIIICMTSAEVGLKHFISSVQVQTEWLLENLPSPNINLILTEYLPELPTKNKINDKVLAPPKAIMDALKKGIGIRNKVAHTGKGAISVDTLENILLAVKDLLWLLDYYKGHTWALEYIRTSTKEDLGI